MDDRIRKKLERCLGSLLSAECKDADAPASACQHRHDVILILAELMPEFKTGNAELDAELNELKTMYRQEFKGAYDTLYG